MVFLNSAAITRRVLPVTLLLMSLVSVHVEAKPLVKPLATRRPAAINEILPQALSRVRKMISYQQSLAKGKRIVESDLVEYLISNPSEINLSDEELFSRLSKSAKQTDPRKHVRLVPARGDSGYEDFKIYFNHARAGRSVANLRQVWIDFLSQAQKEIYLNVFEFDLMPVAVVLAEKAKKIPVDVGVDEKRISSNPSVGKIVDFLRANKVTVHPVKTSQLNHQKMAAIDWSDPKLARALFSSGNLTQSCLGPEGDAVDYPNRPAYSIPNANHVITMKSFIAGQLVHHELSKTFDPNLALKGSSYPTVGTYQITGPGVNPDSLEAYPTPSFIITFTPGGGYRSVSKNLLIDLIDRTQGPVRMIHFAFSNKNLAAALLNRAQREIAKDGKFDFQLVGDTPFALQKWSVPLLMAGYKRLKKQGKDKKEPANFEFDFDSPWRTLGDQQFSSLSQRLHVAPPEYSTHRWTPPNSKDDVLINAKIHHKVLTSSDFAVVGSSFNFSERAELNHEQILIFRDPKIVEEVELAIKSLIEKSPRILGAEVERRMGFYTKWRDKQSPSTEDDDDDDDDAAAASSSST